MGLRAWNDEWNNIIRDVLFADEELRTLMKIPEKTTIIEFIDRYFIRAGFSNSLVVDEPVRIIYGKVGSSTTDSPFVLRNEVSFDIYVKREEQHNVEKDRLMYRTDQIANRINYLLTHTRYVQGYRFWQVNDLDLGTTTVGYVRRNISFQYMKAY